MVDHSLLPQDRIICVGRYFYNGIRILGISCRTNLKLCHLLSCGWKLEALSTKIKNNRTLRSIFAENKLAYRTDSVIHILDALKADVCWERKHTHTHTHPSTENRENCFNQTHFLFLFQYRPICRTNWTSSYIMIQNVIYIQHKLIHGNRSTVSWVKPT